MEGKVLFKRNKRLRHLADGDSSRAIGIDLGSDKALGPVGESNHRNHRADADDHAEKRENRAQLIGPQRLQREPHGLNQLHGFRPLCGEPDPSPPESGPHSQVDHNVIRFSTVYANGERQGNRKSRE